jgi:hypothetical protein
MSQPPGTNALNGSNAKENQSAPVDGIIFKEYKFEHRRETSRSQLVFQIATAEKLHHERLVPETCSSSHNQLLRLSFVLHLSRYDVNRICNSLVRADKTAQQSQNINNNRDDACDVEDAEDCSE